VAQAKPDKPMSKSQIATHMAEKFEMTRKQATEIIDELANLAYNETKKRGEFTIPGVGKLVKQQRKARTGRNPATGEAIKIPAKTVVKFRVAKAAKDAVLPIKKK
jgi:DNA-binding protein HU-beta